MSHYTFTSFVEQRGDVEKSSHSSHDATVSTYSVS